MWIYTSTPHMPSWRSTYLVTHRTTLPLPYIATFLKVKLTFVITDN
jgi:hypothetical protein